MSEKFVENHQGKIDDISLYGQESNETTYRLCRMNLAIRNIDGSQVKWNKEGSFLNNAHPDLKADYILANPPFNDSDWSGRQLAGDGRWKYGVPPPGNANFAWVQHFIHHLSPRGGCRLCAVKRIAHVQVLKRGCHSQEHRGRRVGGLYRQPAGKTVPEYANPRLPVVRLPANGMGITVSESVMMKFFSWTPTKWGT